MVQYSNVPVLKNLNKYTMTIRRWYRARSCVCLVVSKLVCQEELWDCLVRGYSRKLALYATTIKIGCIWKNEWRTKRNWSLWSAILGDEMQKCRDGDVNLLLSTISCRTSNKQEFVSTLRAKLGTSSRICRSNVIRKGAQPRTGSHTSNTSSRLFAKAQRGWRTQGITGSVNESRNCNNASPYASAIALWSLPAGKSLAIEVPSRCWVSKCWKDLVQTCVYI